MRGHAGWAFTPGTNSIIYKSMARWSEAHKGRVKPIREEIFKILYMDRIGKRDERVKDLSTNQLINEFEERKGGNIAILRQELRHRFIECLGDDRIKITAAFNRATKGDRMWVDLQIRKEQRLGKIPF